MPSPSGKLDLTDAKKIAISALFVGGAAALSYVLNNVSGMDFGAATALVVPIVTTSLTAVITWLKDNSK